MSSQMEIMETSENVLVSQKPVQLTTVKILIADFESSEINSKTAAILQMAFYDPNQKTHFVSYVKDVGPKKEPILWSKFAELHLDKNSVRNASTFDEVMKNLNQWIGSDCSEVTILFHNMSFDVSLLKKQLRSLGNCSCWILDFWIQTDVSS